MKKRGLRTLFKGMCVIVVTLVLMVVMSIGAKPAPAKVIELKFAYHTAPTQPLAVNGLNVWAKNVEKATGGRVKIIVYPAQTLCKGRDTWEAVKTGIADVGFAYMGLFAGRFPVTDVIALPCMGQYAPFGKSAQIASRVIMEAYYKFPEIQAEYRDVKLLHINSHESAFVATGKKPVRRLEDLKGLKLRIAGTYITEFMKAVGAVPMRMSPAAQYENMQKRVIDGFAYTWEGFVGRRMYEVTGYLTDAKWYVAPFFTIMNLRKWNSLPPDIQKAIEGVSGLKAALILSKCMDDVEGRARQICKDRNIEIIKPSPEEKDRWQQAARPVWDKWLSNMKAKGIPGQKILDETKRLFKKYSP